MKMIEKSLIIKSVKKKENKQNKLSTKIVYIYIILPINYYPFTYITILYLLLELTFLIMHALYSKYILFNVFL